MNDEAYDTLLKRLTEARGTFDWNSTKGLVAASCAVHRACWEFQRDLSNALSIYQAADDDQPELPFQARGWPNLAKWLDELKRSFVEYMKNCGLRGYSRTSSASGRADVIMELYEAEGQQAGTRPRLLRRRCSALSSGYRSAEPKTTLTKQSV